MIHLLDTSVAVALLDDDAAVKARFLTITAASISIMTRVELEGGVYTRRDGVRRSREQLDMFLRQFPSAPFDDRCAAAYAAIVEAAGFSRRKIMDRMIAAQALVQRADLITLNPADFRDVPGLTVIDWS